MAVAVDQIHIFKPFSRPPICKLPSYSQLDYSMVESSQQTNFTQTTNINIACDLKSLPRSSSTPCLSISNSTRQLDSNNSRIEIIGGQRAPRARALVVEVGIAVASGVYPEPVSTGLGGAYFLKKSQNGKKIVAVAKPTDEEPLALNNPKGFAGRLLGQPGLKQSIMVGETGVRELAAYLLDHGGFAGVPPTALVKMSHNKFHVHQSPPPPPPPPDSSFSAAAAAATTPAASKIVSLQRFVDHDFDAGDLGPSGFSVASIHRIGIVDVRLLNLDRHAGNLLVKKGQGCHSIGTAELVPIDHGFCLPEALDDPYFEWLHWPQALIPFSETEIEYISNLDPFKDAEMLRIELPSLKESAIRVFVLCNIFLKQAVEFGMCLADIGQMMTRDFQGGEENWSALEDLCLDAIQSSKNYYDDISSSNQVEEDMDDVFQFDEEDNTSSRQVSPKSAAGVEQLKNLASFLSEKTMINKLGGGIEESFLLAGDEIHKIVREDSVDKEEEEHKKTNNNIDDSKLISLMRSKSFAVPSRSNDSAGISFGEMSNEEWESFLQRFKQFLSEFIDARKGMCMSKERLGNSCEF